MAKARAHRRERSCPLPGWAARCCAILGAALVLHALLPLIHAAEHGLRNHRTVALADSPGHRTPAAADSPDTTGHDEPACPTCQELLLVKQVVPWQSPVLLPFPEAAATPAPCRAESRPVPVDRRTTGARGPPARA